MRPSFLYRLKASSSGIDGATHAKTADGVAVSIVQRGVDRAATFFDSEDYLLYLELLRDAYELLGLQVHAYCLITNHIHLSLTPVEAAKLSPAMKRLTQIYVKRVNRNYFRSGLCGHGDIRQVFLVLIDISSVATATSS